MYSIYYVVLPARSPLLTTAVGLVELGLFDMPLLDSFRPCELVARQLESLLIGFKPPVPIRDVERQLLHTPHRNTG